MIAPELVEQVRTEAEHMKAVQDQFLQTYKQLCVHFGGPKWQEKKIETTFHHVRQEVIPLMERVGMDHDGVQALCSWAEKLVVRR